MHPKCFRANGVLLVQQKKAEKFDLIRVCVCAKREQLDCSAEIARISEQRQANIKRQVNTVAITVELQSFD